MPCFGARLGECIDQRLYTCIFRLVLPAQTGARAWAVYFPFRSAAQEPTGERVAWLACSPGTPSPLPPGKAV